MNEAALSEAHEKSMPEIILISSQSSQEYPGAPDPLQVSGALIPLVGSLSTIDVSPSEEWGLWGF